jgi:nucleoside-diphosphate-sugar epimerase
MVLTPKNVHVESLLKHRRSGSHSDESNREDRKVNIALTGCNGFIGSHILSALLSHGHEVEALVRHEEEAEAVRARGAQPTIVDLYDRPAVAKVLTGVDGAVHTASPGDETSAAFDSAVFDAAIDAYGASGKPFVPISGAWVYGNNTNIAEASPQNSPAMVAWKEPLQRRLLSQTGMRGIIVLSSVAYGDGGGLIPRIVLGSPRDPDGNLIMLGTGQQHWSTVHVADLADFFRRVLEDDSARGLYVIGNGLNPTVAEITEAAAVAVGAPGAVAGSDDEAGSRLGAYLAEVLLLDQGTQAARARAELGWEPTHAGLVEEFRTGSYRI